MNDTIEFERKYFVIKIDDANKYLNDGYRFLLADCLIRIEEGRRKDGKKTMNNYLVINTDESYASEIAEIMKTHGHYTPGGEIKVNISK
jgi:hypothetical protein